MIHVIIALLLLVLAPGGTPITDWTTVPPGDLIFQTGHCQTELVPGPPQYWSAPEQCFDGAQNLSRATIRYQLARFPPRGKTRVWLTIVCQCEFVKVWIGQIEYATYAASANVRLDLPLGQPITLQAIHNSGAPAEIYATDMEYK
jgi:hypothetical protein